MPYKDPSQQKAAQKQWYLNKRSKIISKSDRCSNCSATEKLTYGDKILCLSCRNTKNTRHLKKPNKIRLLQLRKRKVKLTLRRKLGLPDRTPIDEEVALTWLIKGENDMNYELIAKEIHSPALKEIGAEMAKIYKEIENTKTPQVYAESQLKIRMCRSFLTIIAMERFLKPDNSNRKMIPLLREK